MAIEYPECLGGSRHDGKGWINTQWYHSVR